MGPPTDQLQSDCSTCYNYNSNDIEGIGGAILKGPRENIVSRATSKKKGKKSIGKKKIPAY